MLGETLPDHFFKAETIPADRLGPYRETVQTELNRARLASGWNPKITELWGDFVAVDLTAKQGSHDLSTADVLEYVDHPFLKDLPLNAPRAVKSIYRKEVRLKHYRATDAMVVIADMDRADLAWHDYCDAAGVDCSKLLKVPHVWMSLQDRMQGWPHTPTTHQGGSA